MYWHAQALIGETDRDEGAYIRDAIRTSWGRDWGHKGDFFMPTAFFENAYLADDAWTIRKL